MGAHPKISSALEVKDLGWCAVAREHEEVLTIGEVAARSGFAPSAVRYYEAEGLISSIRTAGNHRLFHRHVLRRLAFIRAGRRVGLSIEELAAALSTLPADRAPTKAQWTRLSRAWRGRLDERIEALEALRDGLDSCIGCGCLSLRACRLFNPDDRAAAAGDGPRYLLGDTPDGPGT
jgi:MerR family redox-sensitive transcriptional activator SoxR